MILQSETSGKNAEFWTTLICIFLCLQQCNRAKVLHFSATCKNCQSQTRAEMVVAFFFGSKSHATCTCLQGLDLCLGGLIEVIKVKAKSCFFEKPKRSIIEHQPKFFPIFYVMMITTTTSTAEELGCVRKNSSRASFRHHGYFYCSMFKVDTIFMAYLLLCKCAKKEGSNWF